MWRFCTPGRTCTAPSTAIFPPRAASTGRRCGIAPRRSTRRAELTAKAQAEAAAAEAERVARDAERAARTADQRDSAADRENALRAAEEAVRRASAERVEAARRAEAAAIAEANARREEREIAEAHASAERQAKSYSHSEIRRRYLAGPQPSDVPSLAGDPYAYVHTEAPLVEHHIPRAGPGLRLSRSLSR